MAGAQDRRLTRGALEALLDAVASIRQHPERAGLHKAVLRKAHAALLAATGQGPLVIGLRPAGHAVANEEGNRVTVDDEPTGATTTGNRSAPPFRPLTAAGVADVVLLPGLTASELHRLAHHLAATTPADDPEQAVHRLQRDSALVHVQLRAAATNDGDARDDEALDWTELPTVASRSPAVAALVARDLAGNLPALVARQILDDLATLPAAGERTLTQLLPRLLDRGDLATASWLLAEVTHDAPHLADELRRIAAARADTGWLTQLLTHGTRDELMQLCTFVMQLPDEVPMRFADLLASTAHPLARWLRDLLV